MSAMGPKRGSKSGLFLMELIIAILFFAVASAICVQLFVKAHLMSVRSQDLTMAVNRAQSAAEQFKAADTGEALGRLLGAPEQEGAYVLCYDEDWNRAEDGPYTLTLRVREGQPQTAEIAVSKEGHEDPLYVLTAKQYRP